MGGLSAKLGLAGEHVLEFRVCPLMQALVHSVTVGDPLSGSCEVSDYDRSCPSLVEDIYKPRRDFGQEILDLVADLRSLLIFRSNEPASNAYFPCSYGRSSFLRSIFDRRLEYVRLCCLRSERSRPP